MINQAWTSIYKLHKQYLPIHQSFFIVPITSTTTMSHPGDLEHEEDDNAQLNDEDIVEVHEDNDDDQPMDDEDDDDNEKYDGEIVIGAPMPGEEEALADMENMYEDNTLGSTCTCIKVGDYQSSLPRFLCSLSRHILKASD